MCNRLSRRNRPYQYPQKEEDIKNFKKWQRDYQFGKNCYRLRMLEETQCFFNKMVGDSSVSNRRKINAAHDKGFTTCHHRPARVKHMEKLDRYLDRTYHRVH